MHAAAEESAAKRHCRTSSEVSDDDDGDSMSFNQGACAVEPAPRRNLKAEEGKLMLLADNTQRGMLDFADNLRSHEYRNASMGQRATTAMLSQLKELR